MPGRSIPRRRGGEEARWGRGRQTGHAPDRPRAGLLLISLATIARDVTREADIDVVAKGDGEAAFVVFPSGDAGSTPVRVVSYEEP